MRRPPSWTHYIGLCPQPEKKRVLRDRLQSATPKKENTIIFNHYYTAYYYQTHYTH